MDLFVCSLLESTSPDGKQEVVRVLHLDRSEDRACVIHIYRPDALPEIRKLSEIEAGLADKSVRVLITDPYAYLQKPEETIPAKHRRRRDAAWTVIQPIVTAPGPAALHPDTRGPLVRTAIAKAGGCKKHLYRHLRRYWQGGLTPNALLPLFHLCGAPGKGRKAGNAKRGRPRLLAKHNGTSAGINVGPNEAELLRKGFQMFYAKAPDDGGLTLRGAYERTLAKFFKRGFEYEQGVPVPVLPPNEELPSFRQFLYWSRDRADLKDTLIRRQGERRFNLKSRAVLGDATLQAFGPGSQLQIDSTPTDVWLVSSLDRSRRLGRPTMYLVLDTFSHLIVGFYVGLDNASFFSAGLALENATVDKVAFCAQFGIDITPEEWPNCGLPEEILADRGELKGHAASNLVQSLNIRISNTAPFRADFKPIVERTIRSIHDVLTHHLPGAVLKPKERGERDYRMGAALTLKELRILMIRAILEENGRRIEGYRLQKDMIADGVQPRPIDLWNWGVQNRTGHLRSIDPVILRANLLPSDKATVTHHGIRFRGLFYSCERAIHERWYERARATKSWQVDATYDPRIVDVVYLRLPGSGSIEPCQLLEADQRFQGVSWEDVDDFFLSQKETRENTSTSDLQSRTEFHAQLDAVVKNAVQAATTANNGLTKSARLRGVRRNRADERRRDGAVTGNGAAQESARQGNNGDGISAGRDADHSSEAYVPPPSHFEMLRQQHEDKWRRNE
jgi:hypothetical protein